MVVVGDALAMGRTGSRMRGVIWEIGYVVRWEKRGNASKIGEECRVTQATWNDTVRSCGGTVVSVVYDRRATRHTVL